MMGLITPKKQIISPTKLHEKYIVPPFSVINSHQTYVKNRFAFWENIGLCAEDGRAEHLAYDNRRMNKRRKKHINGTSVFNPVLCEVLYKWFTLPNSNVLDPFAGGVVRGAMASILGHSYVGYDVSKEQIESNQRIFENIKSRYEINDRTTWINDSSINIKIPWTENMSVNSQYDFVITCPPYYNLEKYTDDPRDLSNQISYGEFLRLYREILVRSALSLREDCFFAITVSEIRDKKTTEYLGFVPDTISILMRDCMLKYYNEIILYNDTGNLAITSGNYLDLARKVGRQHQNVLIFYKGNPKNIKDKFGAFER